MLVHERALTNEARWRPRLATSARCPCRDDLLGDVLHVLRDCPKASEIWYVFHPQGRVDDFFSLPLCEWFLRNLSFQQEAGDGFVLGRKDGYNMLGHMELAQQGDF